MSTSGAKSKEQFCKICKVTCNTISQLQFHVMGGKHKKKEEELGLTASKKIIPTSKKSKSLQQYFKNSSLGEPVVGLQYVVEYRNRNPLIPDKYLCKLCDVRSAQVGMISHITGWKHRFNYLKKKHPEMLPLDNTNAKVKLHPLIKEKAQLLEKKDGKGKVQVVIEETVDEKASTAAKSDHIDPQMSVRSHMDMPLDMREFEAPFQGRGFPKDVVYGQPFDTFSSGQSIDRFPGDRFSDLSSNRFHDDEHDRVGRLDFDARRVGRRVGIRSKYDTLVGTSGPDCTQDMFSGPSEASFESSTLFECLENFRIQNERDAQIVLRVTQKLTDILMEYRLRTMSDPSANEYFSDHEEYPPSRRRRTDDGFRGSRYSDNLSPISDVQQRFRGRDSWD
ncbi:uncharacterized protein si:ch211-197h24.6 isoform X2 [Polypterus senegalus]|nr:uncharacterized protein si:ch211-197h24.6 isoform X2 [Polypterus senegalus]XP_039593432.1 uncharacterized protein si:ch211-197h24.6 isoform X2 [Polypterus senegalus]XP_039593433.1 uncharacterized protein si:ch211-197h24.6 isoform X2 [Polypterus senegalus]XP_039593434.1 uncharacterized protein si:ch211-197h24.6 isoform X2 [Polypterus senegalus]